MSSTNKTTYYELPQFVDNDIFNPLVDDNDAYSKIDTALHNIAGAEADDASEIVGIKSRLDSAEGDIDALEAQNGDSVLTTTAQTLSGAVNELDADISSLDGRLDIVEDDINNVSTGLKAKVDDLGTRMTTAEGDINVLETQNGSETLTTTAQTLSGAVNELKQNVLDVISTVPDVLNIVSLGADNTGTTDNSILFNSLFGNHDYDRRTFYFPDGVYLINSGVLVNNGCCLVLSNNAVIKAGEAMDCMFMFNTIPLEDAGYKVFRDTYLYSNMKLIGGKFDGNKLAGTCIRARRFCNFTIDSVKVLNFNTCGIDTKTPYDVENEQTAELKLLNCYVTNFGNNTAPATCVKVGTDNEIANCILVDGLVGIEIASANEFSNLHIWTSNDATANNGTAIKVSGTANKFSNLYCDSYFNAFDLASAGYCYVSNMTYLARNSHYIDFNGYIFNQSTVSNMKICIDNLFIDSDKDVNFTNRYTQCQLSNFTSNNNNCVPISPVLPAWGSMNKYIYDNALTSITSSLPAGIYGVKINATYKPNTGHSGMLIFIPFPSNGLKIYFDFTTKKMYIKVNGADTDDWYDVVSGTTIASST